MTLKEQYGITQLSEVKAALACYAALRSELNSSDPAEVQEALALLSAVRASGSAGAALDTRQLGQALGISAVCKQRLGPNADAQQLQAALSAAEVCRQELGVEASEQKLREALEAARACQAELGHCNALEVQQALATAAVARQELGADCSKQQLREALAAAAVVQQELGSLDSEQLQQRLALATVAKQQLGSNADPQRLRDALQLGEAAQQAGVAQAGQLQAQLKLAAAAAAASTPEEVAGALALHRAVEEAAGHASPEQVKAALKLQQAAEDEGISDAAGLSAALAAAAAAATAAARSEASFSGAATAAAAPPSESGTRGSQDDEARSLGAIAVAQGVTDPSELQVALSTYRHLRRDGHAFDPRNARRACSMYAAAQTHGIADKRDFMAAAALYGVLREDGITSAGELRLAVAMYGAVREEGILDPEDLHAAIELASIARDEGLAHANELRAVLAASRGSFYYQGAAAAAVSADGSGRGMQLDRLGSLRQTANGGAGEGSITDALLQQQVAALQHQLESEKAARSKYAKQLEQQAVEWMGQVKLLKEYIDSLRAKMPSHSSGGAPMPTLQLPTSPPGQLGNKNSSGGGAGNETRRLVQGLEGDWATKAPLFDDDAAFIGEVVDGDVLAPEMQVQLELDRLRQKYEAWNKQFKERMREVQASLRRGNGATAQPGGVAGSLRRSGSSSALRQQAAGATKAAAAPGSVPPAADAPSGSAVNLKTLPDLASPNLLEMEEWGDGQGVDGGKKKKGLFRGLLK